MNRISTLFRSTIIVLVVFLCACTTQKNTSLTRAYHDLTAHYNVLFNGSESFKKGMKKVDETFKDDYSRILPVFKYGNKDVASAVASDMDAAIKKATKMISLHSIKVKPKVKKGEHLTPEEKEFYNKNEFNKWIDNGYLLMGKAYVYKSEYNRAFETFDFVTREFPKEISKYEALIWIARIHAENAEYREAELGVTSLEGDKKFPKKLLLDLYVTSTDIALKQSHYDAAIKSLEKAMKLVHKRKLKIRYTYILAQLYQKTEQFKKATEMYIKVIRKNPPYEMTFNARINLASSTEAGSKNNRYIKDQLRKMLRNDKNKEYQDQIYFALGNLEMKEGNRNKGIEDYKESVKVSTTNNAQKALSCLTLADLFYGDKNYIPAQVYYDSTLLYIAENYPGISDLKIKAKSLTRLVLNLNTITLEDSLQRIAKLPEAQRIKLVDDIISNLRKKEAEAQIEEQQRLQEYYANQSRMNLTQSNNQANWYFYNPVSVDQGMKDFQLRWGKRRLEDNWRRRNKGMSSFGAETAENEGDTKKLENEKKKTQDNKSREFYTQNIPVNDSMLKASTRRIIDAYYYGGQVYRSELKDLPQAIALYEKMLERFPDNVYLIPVCYQLYTIFTELNNVSKANYYKNLVLTKSPESNYAKLLTDPNFYKQMMEKEKEADRFYEQSYDLYKVGNYQQVITNSQQALIQYKTDPVRPKFALLKAMAIGKTADRMVFRNELNLVIATYPKSDVSNYAKEIIAYMNVSNPETKQKEDLKVAEVIYSTEEKTTFYFALLVEKEEDVNQLVFDIINFNLDNFSNEKLEINNEEFGKKFKIITVRSFADKTKAMNYHNAISAIVVKNVKKQTKNTFIISQGNYQILQKQDSFDSYLQFFKTHFQ